MVRNRRRSGRWELPGGRARPGEEPEACARRELLEETGRTMVLPLLVQRRTTETVLTQIGNSNSDSSVEPGCSSYSGGPEAAKIISQA